MHSYGFFFFLCCVWCTPNSMMHSKHHDASLLFSTLNYQQKKYPVLPWPAIFLHRKIWQKPPVTISANTGNSNVCLCTGNTPYKNLNLTPCHQMSKWWSWYDGHCVPHLYRCQYCYVKNYTTSHYIQTSMYNENKCFHFGVEYPTSLCNNWWLGGCNREPRSFLQECFRKLSK